jgi:small GTP-binding protein
MDYDESMKLIVLGDAGVGKTSILKRFVEGRFIGSEDALRGQDVMIKIVQHNSSRIRVQLWDTGGQERFRAVTSSYYRAAAGILLVFDLTDRLSYYELSVWYNDILRYADSVSVMVIGNKLDLNRAVESFDARKWALERGFLYEEASALTGQGVDSAVLRLVNAVHRQHQRRYHSSTLLALDKPSKHRRCSL